MVEIFEPPKRRTLKQKKKEKKSESIGLCYETTDKTGST